MKLTKLSPAPFRGRRCRLMPAPARSDAGTASQLIRGVRRTRGEGDGESGASAVRRSGCTWRDRGCSMRTQIDSAFWQESEPLRHAGRRSSVDRPRQRGARSLQFLYGAGDLGGQHAARARRPLRHRALSGGRRGVRDPQRGSASHGPTPSSGSPASIGVLAVTLVDVAGARRGRASSCRRRQRGVGVVESDAWPPNKRMKQTKLSPAPFRGRRCRLMPAPARSDAGTASQLIRGVRPTKMRSGAQGKGDA